MSRKVAIVTGGTRGIGSGISQHLAQAGYDLVLGYNSNTGAADAHKLALESAHGVKVVTVAGDVAEQSTVDSFFASLESFPGQELGAVVHNAGLYVGKTTTPTSDKASAAAAANQRLLGDGSFNNFDQYDYYQNVYPKCFVRLVEGAAAHMKEGGGHIVATSSPGCNNNQNPVKSYMLPGQAKASVEYLVRHYALLLAPKHITVNVIIPGFTRTDAWLPMAAQMPGGIDGDVMRGMMEKGCPMKRWGTASEMGGVVAFLCSPAASYITGLAIPVDGGLHLN